jgi:hypothetical protein
MKAASCARPSLWGGIRRDGLTEIFQSPAGYWLIRKFPGDKLPGRAQLIDGPNEAQVLGRMMEMRIQWEKLGIVDVSLLQQSEEDGQDTLDVAAAKLIMEKRNKPAIPLMIIPDPAADHLQSLRKAADASAPQPPNISGFPHWTTFTRLDMSGLVFGKTTGMLVTAFD